MADVKGPFELSYRECREMYESHYSHLANQHVSLPTGKPFHEAAQEVYDAVGPTEFRKLLEAVRDLHKTEDGNTVAVS